MRNILRLFSTTSVLVLVSLTACVEDDTTAASFQEQAQVEFGQADPAVEDASSTAADTGNTEAGSESGSVSTEAIEAFEVELEPQALRTCQDDSDCPGDCVNYTVPGTSLTAGYCKIITCNSDSQCETDEPCTGGVCGRACSADDDCTTGEYCSGSVCLNLPPGHADFCENGGCRTGEGDCDSDLECVTGVQCRFLAGTDICGNASGAMSFCTPQRPCNYGQGDCDKHADCKWPLRCTGSGPAFGYERRVSVCAF